MEIVYIAVGIARTKNGMPGMANVSGVGSLMWSGRGVKIKMKSKTRTDWMMTMSDFMV